MYGIFIQHYIWVMFPFLLWVIVCSFSLLCSLLREYIITFIFPALDGHISSFHFGVITYDMLLTFLFICFDGYRYTFLLGKYLRVVSSNIFGKVTLILV